MTAPSAPPDKGVDANTGEAQPRTVGAVLLATWIAVIMVVVLPTAVIYATPTPPRGTWIGVLAVTTLAGTRYAWIIGDGRRRLVEMSFWVFTYVFLGLAPLVQLRSGTTPATTPDIDRSLDMTAIVVVVVGILAFLVGLTLSPNTRSARRRAYVSAGVDTTRSVALAFVALAFAAYFISKVGFGTLLSSRTELTEKMALSWPESATSALVGAGSSMSMLVAFLALVKCNYQSKRRDWALIALTVFVGVMLLIMLNPISTARYVFGTAALAVAALFGLLATPHRFRVTAILAVVALIVVFPLADAFRYSSSGEFKTGSPLESLSSPDFDAFSQINNTVLYVERHGTTQGMQAAGVALFWVPRKFWPDKPKDTGIVLAEDRGYSFTNLSAPLWAEMFINGGWILLLLSMFGLGAIAKAQDRRIEQTLRRKRGPALLACILPFYLIILLRGSLLQAMSFLIIIVACSLFVTRFEKAPAI